MTSTTSWFRPASYRFCSTASARDKAASCQSLPRKLRPACRFKSIYIPHHCTASTPTTAQPHHHHCTASTPTTAQHHHHHCTASTPTTAQPPPPPLHSLHHHHYTASTTTTTQPPPPPLHSLHHHHQGAAVCYQMTCHGGHRESWWTDQFYSRKTPRGRQQSRLNVKLATMLLVTGGNFDPMKVLS